MPQEPATRFDDLLLDAVAAIQAMTRRGKPWEETPERERGRALELDRGVAGERRYARQTESGTLLAAIDALAASASARLRMLEGRTTEGDEDLAKKLDRHAVRYAAIARPKATPPTSKGSVGKRAAAKQPASERPAAKGATTKRPATKLPVSKRPAARAKKSS